MTAEFSGVSNADSNQQPAETAHPREISSTELLAGDRTLIIRHNQDLYRLRITNSGKLILTK
ncbi:MAG TPA: hemin uptake protein HemP [Stellaceae bacterium]|nr:hemin uptake protein HemP [Stellaceae bacterium]